MSSVARLCVLALIALFQIGSWQAAWSSSAVSQMSAVQMDDEGRGDGDADAPGGTDEPPGGTDEPPGGTEEPSTPMADDIFEIAVLPVDVSRVKSADPDGRARLELHELRRGRPAPDTPDKPPRA
jgi:hypothetical protein